MQKLLRPEVLITSHIHADFDALAAMLAAGKLYPDATLLLPTLLKRQGGQIFLDKMSAIRELYRPKECDLSAVKLLITVDTRQYSRLLHVESVLAIPDLDIHVYDHHPDSDNDIPADLSVVKFWGATTSILIHILMERGLTVTPEEATLMGLGLFEDTGSFAFSSTTEHDFTAAAFLRGSGMDLEAITEIIGSELTREQVQVLGEMLAGTVTHTICGVPVSITEIVLDEFLGDMATLVHKLMDMEGLKCLFALAVMGEKTYLIARSMLPEVDAALICASFGGGGHSYAASATIKTQPLSEVRNELLTLLVSVITPQMSVGRHMTAPAVTINDDVTTDQAEEIMNHFGLKAMPVLPLDESGKIGMIEQQTAARVCAHKLGRLPVTEYMQRNVITLAPDSSLFEAVEIILKQRQRLIPVLRGRKVVGVLTRTDIIRLLMDDSLRIPEGKPLLSEHRESDVSEVMKQRLPASVVEILRKSGQLGDELGLPVFAVGGFVRDLLLHRQNLDIDLSVEGNGLLFAEKLAELLGGTVKSHKKFKTATVSYVDGEGRGTHLDIATARLEYYEYPGALPTVELSSIKMDLSRRDFTINALAIQLNAERFGSLVDPFGAQRDIKERTIAVLHSLSFVEDPTRILRAARFEKRFNFRIGSQTERLIKNALSLGMLDKLSGARIFNELQHVFSEKNPLDCLKRLDNWNLLNLIHPLLKINPQKEAMLISVEEIRAWYSRLYKAHEPHIWTLHLLAFTDNAKYPQVAELLDRLGFIEKNKAAFLLLRENCRRAFSRFSSLPRVTLPAEDGRGEEKQKEGEEKKAMSGAGCKETPRDRETGSGGTGQPARSLIYDTLNPVQIEGLLYMMAKYGLEHSISKNIAFFLSSLRDARTEIGGEDLLALGETPGPQIGEALGLVLAAKLDGKVKTRAEQLELASLCLTARREGKEMAKLNVTEVLRGRT
ncbi:MAG: CBS domain-containing protein [Desulfovibrio sp.]|jgi:tRNA nucleotidyltransferase (CCA-adding enzyme)|nr:CBS domain-containing protein [Desulfovibrio sp.]